MSSKLTFEHSEEEISTGDIVVDLASGKALQVVGKSGQTVGEHPQTRSDATAVMFGADFDETVFECVFLPDGEKVTPPRKTYAYPASRLLRYPVETATDHEGGMQIWLRTAWLQELADAVAEGEPHAHLRDALEELIAEIYSDDIAGTFQEMIRRTEATS